MAPTIDKIHSITFEPSNKDEPKLLVVSASMIRTDPFRFVTLCLLTPVVAFVLFAVYPLALPVVALPWAWWYLLTRSRTLTITDRRSRFRRGILSKSISEVWHRDVRNVQVSQTFFQRLLSCGSIGISSAGQAGVEIEMRGIPHPYRVKELIDSHRPA